MKKNYLILILTLLCLHVSAQTVSINDTTLGGISTSTFQETPIDPDDNYSYTQSIYLQSEINQTGNISKITYYTNGSLENSNDIVVYMAETANDVFTSNTDWIPLANLTQVFAGTYTVYNNEVSIILDTPFSYSNTANLVIVVDENQDGNDTNDFIAHNLGFSESGRVIHYGNNFNNPDPASPPSGILDYYRPNIELDFNAITCYPPSDVNFTAFNETSVDVDWTSAASNWDYVVQLSGTGNPDAATPVGVSSNAINIPGLTNNTEYELYLRSNCDTDGVSDWIGPIIFRTACGTVDDFSENFESMPDELVTPYCWSTIATSTGTLPTLKVNTSSSQSYSPDNYYEMQLSDDDTVFLVSPESSIIADGMHRIEFAAKVNSINSVTNLKVGLMSNPTDESTFVEMSSITLTNTSSNTNNYSLYYVNVPFNASANYLAFKPETESTFNAIVYLDDIVVTTQPTCFEVLDLEASNITDVSFDLNITPDIQTQTEWEMVVVQTALNFNPALETPIVTSTLTNNITVDSDGAAIIPNSPYRIFVRANCDATGSDGSGYSTWFGPYDTRTACAPFTTNYTENFDSYADADFPFCWYKNVTSTGSPLVEVNTSASFANSGTNAIIMNAGNDSEANVLLIMPQHTNANDGTHRLEFFAKKSNANTEASIIVGTMSDPLDANTFQEITDIPVTNGGGSAVPFEQYFVNLPISSNEYVVLKHSAGVGANIAFYIDDVAITDQPACTEVYNITAENVTASSVEVSWDFLGGQTDWEYVVQAAGTGEPTSGTATSLNISNADFNSLMDNTAYEIYVRANCDTDGFSSWVGPVTFTTACIPESDTFSFGFEGYSNNEEIEPCWSSLIDPLSTSPYVRYSTFQAQEGSISVRLYSGNDETAGVYLITPMLSDFDNTKQIVFHVYDDHNGGLEVGTMTDPTDATTFTSYEVFLDEDMNDDAWDEKTVTFDSYVGTDNYIAFKYNAATTFDNLYIDNFTYEDNPSLSTDDFDLNNTFKIFPNPVNSILNIKGQNIEAIEIFSVNGKSILYQNLNLETVDVSRLEVGMYFINITANNGSSVVKKFVKH